MDMNNDPVERFQQVLKSIQRMASKSGGQRWKIARITFSREMSLDIDSINRAYAGAVDVVAERDSLRVWGIPYSVVDSQTEPIRYWDVSGNEVIPDEPEKQI